METHSAVVPALRDAQQSLKAPGWGGLGGGREAGVLVGSLYQGPACCVNSKHCKPVVRPRMAATWNELVFASVVGFGSFYYYFFIIIIFFLF